MLEWHREQDKIVQGTYWDNGHEPQIEVAGFMLPKSGQGCAVGCSINSLRAITGRTDIEYNDHASYEELIGVPRILARLEDGIFEHLSEEKATEWPLRFAKAIEVGKDLSLVWSRFAFWLLVDEADGIMKFAKSEQSKKAIQDVANLYGLQIQGEIISREKWCAAADAAYAAYAAADADADAAVADAAYAAAVAAADAAYARLSHYEKMADKLISLLECA